MIAEIEQRMRSRTVGLKDLHCSRRRAGSTHDNDSSMTRDLGDDHGYEFDAHKRSNVSVAILLCCLIHSS